MTTTTKNRILRPHLVSAHGIEEEPTSLVTDTFCVLTSVIDQIHKLILEDRRISAKSIAEQLDISRERVGSIIHEDLDMRKLSVKWVPKCLNERESKT